MKSRLFFLGASLSEAALPFVRNLCLAHSLSPSHFGIAVLIASTWSLSEVCLDFGLDRFVMRHPTVDADPQSIATLQTLQLVRALAVGSVIALNAYVFTDLLEAPELFVPLLVVSASTVVRGFANLRAQSVAKDGNFFPHASMILFGQVSWTITTVVLAALISSPIAMAWGIAAANVAATIVSHLTARGRWRLGWSTKMAREAVHFGLPLVPNGMAAAVFHMADRMLVAALLGVAAAGYYTILITVAFLLETALLKYLASMFLPLFANPERSLWRREELNRLWLTLVTGLTFAYSVGVITVAVPLIPFVFGQNYRADASYAALLGVAAFARGMHTVGVPVTMARGRTIYSFYVNFGLACSVGSGVVGALIGGDVMSFLLGLFFGELVVAALILAGLPAILDLPAPLIARTVGIPYAALGVIAIAALSWEGLPFYSLAACVAALVLADLFLRVAPQIGRDYINALRRPHAEPH